MLIKGTKLEKDYKGCGLVWVAFIGGLPQKMIYLDDCPYFLTTDVEVIKLAGRKQACPASDRVADALNRESFLAHKTKSRKELEKFGSIETRMVSCWELV